MPCSRKWVGGEVIQALAYDVPVPGYKTKNTNSLRLWEAKASSEDFNLFQFNDGQYESAGQLHSRAEQVSGVWKVVVLFFYPKSTFLWFGMIYIIGPRFCSIRCCKQFTILKLWIRTICLQICAVLYPGDATESGKLLRLKQQFFLCSASLQVFFLLSSSFSILNYYLWLHFLTIW